MNPVQVSIYAMRTWGELGNLLIARTLKGAIESQPGFAVRLFEAEDFCPSLGRTGEEIRRLSQRTVGDPAARRTGYLGLIADLEERFPAGFEVEEPPSPAVLEETAALGGHLAATRPDLVIGTKGIISRLCLSAARRAGCAAPVVNFVSNHGLLELGIHRSVHLPLNLVQFEEARQKLLDRHGYLPERVEGVGQLIAHHELSGFVASQEGAAALDLLDPDDTETPVVVVFCNRGGMAYLELLRLLADRHPEVPVLFIAYNDPELLAAARALQEERRLRRWALVHRLSQEAYFRIIGELGGSRHALLISKAGPNTVMEVLSFGLIPLVLGSGLPMEEWVPEWLRRRGLGLAAADMPGLAAALDGLLQDRERLGRLKRSVLAFREESIAPLRTAEAIARSLERLLAAYAEPASGRS